VTDAGLKELSALKQLTELDLRKTQVTDEGLKELSALKQLTSVNLYATNVTDEGVAELQRTLPNCRITLREFDIDDSR
jgi:internalin A